MAIRYFEEECRYIFDGKRRVNAWLREVCRSEGRVCKGLNVIFCSGEYLLEMNREFLGHDYMTDVITFDDSTPTEVWGEIYIDVGTVRDNARRFGADMRNEMLRVILHGVLHLCGYGDKTPDEQFVMRKKEDFYLGLFDEDKI